jgi:L-aspartate oxidase
MRASTVSPALPATADEPVEDPPARTALPDPFVIRDLMWRHGGLVRTADGLRAALPQLAAWRAAAAARVAAAPADRECRRVASLATVGFLIARAALRREETRGGHFRADFPDRDDIHFQRHFADVLRT